MAKEESVIDIWFSYHPPQGEEDVERYQRIREAGKAFAQVLVEEVPGTATELATAIEKVREAVMFANAGVACDPALKARAGRIIDRLGER